MNSQTASVTVFSCVGACLSATGRESERNRAEVDGATVRVRRTAVKGKSMVGR